MRIVYVTIALATLAGLSTPFWLGTSPACAQGACPARPCVTDQQCGPECTCQATGTSGELICRSPKR